MAPCSPVVSDQPAFWHLDAARGPSTPSFDHLVGKREHLVWYFEAERLGSAEIDEQLELAYLLHRHVGGFFALENPPGVGAGDAEHVCQAAAVAHQSAGGDELAGLKDR